MSEFKVGDVVEFAVDKDGDPAWDYDFLSSVVGMGVGTVVALDENLVVVKYQDNKFQEKTWYFPLPGHPEYAPNRVGWPKKVEMKVEDTEETSSRETIFDEAKRIVYSDRAKSYGNPEDNFAAIASFWNEYLSHRSTNHSKLSASDVALMLILFKVARATTGVYKRDTAVDIAGYSDCYSRINEMK
jgi:hypothetical protein